MKRLGLLLIPWVALACSNSAPVAEAPSPAGSAAPVSSASSSAGATSGGNLWGEEVPATPPSERKSSESSSEASELPEGARLALQQRQGAFDDCYRKALPKYPEQGSRLVLRLVIGKNGRLFAGGIDEDSTLKTKEVRECVLAELKTIEFPKSEGLGKGVYALEFGGGGAARLGEAP